MRRTPVIASRSAIWDRGPFRTYTCSPTAARRGALSALKRTDDGRPMMQPGGSYTFDINLTSGVANELTVPGTWTPRAIDVVEFDSVRWDDGTHDGRPRFPQVEAIIERDSGRRVQLRRIIEA